MNRNSKDEIKNNLTIEQVENLVAELGGEPIFKAHNILICKTICHGGTSHKLYYYDNTKLFQCYTECGSSFDIYQLVVKVKNLNKENIYTANKDIKKYDLFAAILFVANFFGIEIENDNSIDFNKLPDWDFLYKWEVNKNKNLETSQVVNLPTYDDSFLKHFPTPRIIPWEKEGITKDIINTHKICFDPKNEGIIIPHYNINNKLIGIRERTLIKEEEKFYGKYRPAIFCKKMYNHPLGLNLYNLNWSKINIASFKKAIVCEGEKATLQYASYFSSENDISVAVCGSNLVNYQVSLLLSLGVEEIIIAFDRQYKEIGDEEHKKWVKKFYDLHNKYGKYVQISYILDFEHLLNYKDSPMDRGKEIFLTLFQNRVIL